LRSIKGDICICFGAGKRFKLGFLVKDNGIGFSMDQVDSVFRVFATLHSKQKYKGSGIGLSVFKKIVSDTFGGKVWVQSAPGEGSTFFFTVPKQTHTD